MITGDKKVATSARFALQAAQVDKLAVVYWGRGALWPAMPQEHFDVVTVQDPFWRGLFAWRVARRMGAKFNVQVHTSVLTMLGKFILRRADSIRVVSEKIKKQVEAIGVRTPITVLPIYVDISKFQNIVRQPHSKKIILWIGRFEWEKDPIFAIHIIKNVIDAGVDARLVMLGSGTLEPTIQKLAQDLPVEFAGWQDPVPYLEQADMVLSTSLHEGYGASMVEALAAGVPVVAPDVGIAREAGAIVAPRLQLAQATIDTLRSGAVGTLRLAVPSRQEWAEKWKQSLQ